MIQVMAIVTCKECKGTKRNGFIKAGGYSYALVCRNCRGTGYVMIPYAASPNL